MSNRTVSALTLDQLVEFRPIWLLAAAWLLVIAYSLVPPELSHLIRSLVAAFVICLVWLAYPLIIYFGLASDSTRTSRRIAVEVSAAVFLVSLLLQAISEFADTALRMISLATVLVIEISAADRLVRARHDNSNGIAVGVVKGVVWLLFLPFFGAIPIHRLLRRAKSESV